MKKTYIKILILILIFNTIVLSCDNSFEDETDTIGTLTVYGLDAYNGKYILGTGITLDYNESLWAVSAISQNEEILSITLGKVNNGKVTLNVYEFNLSEIANERYSPFNETAPVPVLFMFFLSEDPTFSGPITNDEEYNEYCCEYCFDYCFEDCYDFCFEEGCEHYRGECCNECCKEDDETDFPIKQIGGSIVNFIDGKGTAHFIPDFMTIR